ncbi:hypothetical protein ACHAXA_001523 [Cyclostephanos tholiformis]|jgi:hypothetical protein|uniref:Uncharacterized protein n=1 Tax=Cyclostephanos tholiformis TaxID=382380 RepID=A0ABD3RX36_9STRA
MQQANVRRIKRGELGIVKLLDMGAEYLDDKELVARSRGLMMKAESLVDTFEAASAQEEHMKQIKLTFPAKEMTTNNATEFFAALIAAMAHLLRFSHFLFLISVVESISLLSNEAKNQTRCELTIEPTKLD